MDLYYKIIRFLGFDRYDIVKTEIPKTQYADTDQRMLYSVMKIICDFVEEEMDIVDWSMFPEDVEASKNILKAYIWWKYDRPKDVDYHIDLWWEGKITLKESTKIENEINQKDQEALNCAVKAWDHLSV